MSSLGVSMLASTQKQSTSEADKDLRFVGIYSQREVSDKHKLWPYDGAEWKAKGSYQIRPLTCWLFYSKSQSIVQKY